MELLRDALGRNVAMAGPDDVLDVEAVVLRLVALPDADLRKGWEVSLVGFYTGIIVI